MQKLTHGSEPFNAALLSRSFMEDILYNMPGFVYWKNRKSQYLGFNKNMVILSGLSREALWGKTDEELNWGVKEAESFQKDDQEVIESGGIKITEHQLPIKRVDGNNMVVRTEKSCLIDERGHIVGVLGVAMDVTDEKLIPKFVNHLNLFTPRESDVFNYIFLGLTSKKIAKRLELSHRTIEDYVERIKIKLDCTSKSEITETAIRLGIVRRVL